MQGFSLENRRLSVHDVAFFLGISFMSVQSSLNMDGLMPNFIYVSPEQFEHGWFDAKFVP
jgi:hypothetical protein